ncbi:MAG: response regulator [Chitinophagales bacterium]
MLGFSNKEYREKIAALKQQLSITDDKDKVPLYETLYNCYARMGLLLEAEKVTFELVALLRKTLPKSKLIVEEMRLCKLMIDNGKVQQGLEHLKYCMNLCSFEESENKERYIVNLMHINYSLSLRDESYRAQYEHYLHQYQTLIKPVTTLEKLDYYIELSNAFFNNNRREEGLAYKSKAEKLLAASTELSDAYRERYRSYLQQLAVGELRSDPDQQKLITHANGILERNKKEKFLPTAAVFFWLRTLANAYKKVNDIEGLKRTFNEYQFAINDYVEENIDNKIYEQKYQSDYFLQEQKLKDAEALNKVKDSVFSNFNHELRTPLNIILSNCELIARDGALPAGSSKRLNAIQNQSYNLLNIIDQFIEINKTNLQFNKVNNETGDIVQFLQLMVTDLATLAEHNGIALKLELNKVKQLVCELDFAKLERILYNLITNAIKFTNKGGKVKVELSLNKRNKQLQLSISDTGIGIAKNELNTIFHQFYSAKSDNENIKTSTGFGIGLYLVKQLVDLLGGAIQVESKLKKGSTFTVTLPLVENKNTGQHQIHKRLNYRHAAAAEKPAVSKKKTEAATDKPSILIVEDNSDLLEIIHASLENNFVIETAENGKEALKVLEHFMPDLVITDLMMPRMNGIELTSHIKQSAAFNHLPVIMLTAKGSLPNRIKGWQAGIDVFLRKPFSITELEHCIHNIMQTRANAKERIATLLVNRAGVKTKAESPAEKFVKQFKDFVLANISEGKLHNAALAKHLQMDESSMYRKIKSLTGYPPVQLVTRLKILRAKELIEAQQFSTVKEVAYHCGFNDPKYFSRVYKAETGSLPKLGNHTAA